MRAIVLLIGLLTTLTLLGVLVIGCMSSASSPTPTRPALSCRLEARLEGKPPTSLRFELANGWDAPMRVLVWNTPLEGWKGTVLRVTRDGEELPYQGPMLKRGDPQAEAYVEIPAGGKVDATVDLADVYDVSRPGTYQVEADGNLIDVTAEPVPRPRDRHQPQPLDCGTVTFTVPGR